MKKLTRKCAIIIFVQCSVKQPNMFKYTYKGCAFVDSAMSDDCHQYNGYNLHEPNLPETVLSLYLRVNVL